MTISYPRDLFSYRLGECTFSLVEPVSVSRTGGGRAISAVEYADPYWSARFVTHNPTMPTERKGWSAWKKSLRGGTKSFLAYDKTRCELIAYPKGHPSIIDSSWNGQGTVSALEPRLITALGAPSEFTMHEGDHIGMVENGRYGLFEVQETVVRGGSTIAVPVEPTIPLNIFTAAATVVFYRPRAEFILLGDTWNERGTMEFSPVSFEAMQKI